MTLQIKPLKVIISGAGIIGLLLANALKDRGIEYVVLDRDISVLFRENSGWAITLHYALEYFQDLLPKDKADEIIEAQVRPGFHLDDRGTFKFINATTGETVVSIPPASRLRVRREQIRRILLRDIDVNWDCKLTNIEYQDDDIVKVHCENGKVFEGNLLFGCEGANSATRRLLDPEEGGLYQLPIRFCGAKVQMSGEEYNRLSSKFDPLLFQGTVPENETFFWYSLLATPDYTKQQDTYYAQVNMSWKVPAYDEPFTTSSEMAQAMKSHSAGLNEELAWLVKRAVSNPDELLEIKLCDWAKVDWDNKNGRVLLAGDSAHAMTMYRGEACNVGILDAYMFILQLDLYIKGEKAWLDVVRDYSGEVKERAQERVLLSRQACLDAHDMTKIHKNSDSPLLSVRKKS